MKSEIDPILFWFEVDSISGLLKTAKADRYVTDRANNCLAMDISQDQIGFHSFLFRMRVKLGELNKGKERDLMRDRSRSQISEM